MKNVNHLLKKGPDVQKDEKCLLISFEKGAQHPDCPPVFYLLLVTLVSPGFYF